MDDPYYFLNNARKIRKERKRFEKKKETINEEIERLRLFKNRPLIDPEDAKAADIKIEMLIRKRKRTFEDAYQKASCGDLLENQSLKVEKNILITQKIISFPFKMALKILKKI
jgi:hypothetical protein